MATTQASTASTTEALPAEAGTPPTGGVDREFTVQARSQRQQVIRHFLHNKVGMTGLVIFVIMMLFGFVGPFIHQVDYATQNQNAQSVPPGTQGYILGSDAIGRDPVAGQVQGVHGRMFIEERLEAIPRPLG